MHLGPEDVLLALEIEFRPGLSAAEVAAAIDRMDRAIRAGHPEVRHLCIEAQAIREAKDAHGRVPAEQVPPPA